MLWSLAARFAKTLPGEAAHRLAVTSLANGIGPDYRKALTSDRLKTTVAGLSLPNPIGLAAGFDKNAEAMTGALKLGFGFVEVGTITPKAQPGNPKPRVFRLPSDGAVINRYGFNNDGMALHVIGLLRIARLMMAVLLALISVRIKMLMTVLLITMKQRATLRHWLIM